jgi:hypothetical protein
VLLLLWLLGPSLLAVAVSRSTPVNVVVPHYLVGAAPALAALVGGALGSLTASRGRAIAAAVMILAAAAAQGGIPRTREDWRGAAAVVREAAAPATPVLVVSGLVESGDARWLQDADKAVYLTAPFRHYPVPGRLVAFPWTVNAGTLAYLDGLIAALRAEPRFVLVARGDGSDIARFLLQRLGPGAFAPRRVAVEGLYVAVFDAAPPPAP